MKPIAPAYRYLLDLYLDWVNNYASTSRFAEDHGLEPDDARRLIEIGRNLHYQLADLWRT